ncbi:isoprenylcysteine carboxylmethyltransferase family protein [Nocardia yunnanensis]|uniref:Isoprenylcysteine carboxylmethyltransferase family protein n=1 Tax=Nocardia yunnanensis TaxID=2382165 RepID=A0A386Z946_9NOCA|nr:isoprenylcysteine carboxylmethyltransferase family protein [Nocardia yunnanensis]AYF73737.1 isoprenylcysteine carboxylmethyltransferase family protein [Nocardia yunnanensis]
MVTRAAWGSLLFTVVVPGTVAGLLPLLISRWRVAHELWPAIPLRVLGGLLIVASLPILIGAIVRFAVEGRGTPAPIAPTRQLVVGGPNRYVRNPMYLAVVSIVLGQGLLLGRTDLLWYGLLVALGQAAFVHFYEEPTLRRQFGDDYDRYRDGVRAWIPRLRPWNGR